jgi:hypothetical protein
LSQTKRAKMAATSAPFLLDAKPWKCQIQSPTRMSGVTSQRINISPFAPQIKGE